MNKKSTSQIASFLVFGLITWGMVSCNSSDTQHNPITNSETTQPTQKKEVVETDPSISISNGQAVIRYEMTPEDFVSSKETHWRWVGDRVLKALKNPDVNTIQLIVVDNCKDEKGNISKYESKLNFDNKTVLEFRTYKDRDSFVYNCGEWTAAVFKWYRCGFDEANQMMHYD
jgi:hypothetical protein